MNYNQALTQAQKLVDDYYQSVTLFFPPDNQDWARHVFNELTAGGEELDADLKAYIRQARMPVLPSQFRYALTTSLVVANFDYSEKILRMVHGHCCECEPSANPVYIVAHNLLVGYRKQVPTDEVHGFSISSWQTLRRVLELDDAVDKKQLVEFDKLNASLGCV